MRVEGYSEANRRIRNHIVRLGHHVRGMLVDAVFIPFATMAFGCLAKIGANLDRIEKKLEVIRKIVEEVGRKQGL